MASAAEAAEAAAAAAVEGLTKAQDAMTLGDGKQNRQGKRRARHTCVSFFVGTLRGNFITLIGIGMFLILFGALAWLGAGCGAESCGDYPATFDSAWWLSWGLYFDPGTQTGISALEGGKQKWVAVSFSILGFILNLILLGLIVESMRQLLDAWRATYGRIIENDHTVCRRRRRHLAFAARTRRSLRARLRTHAERRRSLRYRATCPLRQTTALTETTAPAAPTVARTNHTDRLDSVPAPRRTPPSPSAPLTPPPPPPRPPRVPRPAGGPRLDRQDALPAGGAR
jgi:hypothetical protein